MRVTARFQALSFFTEEVVLRLLCSNSSVGTQKRFNAPLTCAPNPGQCGTWYSVHYQSTRKLSSPQLQTTFVTFGIRHIQSKCIVTTAICVPVPCHVPTLMHGPGNFKNRIILSQNYSVFNITTINNSLCPPHASYLTKSAPLSRIAHGKQGM